MGGWKILPCNFLPPTPDHNNNNNNNNNYIIQWRKRGIEVPVFLKRQGVRESVIEAYMGRIELLERASIRLSDIRKSDEGFYDCSVINLATRETTNITSLYLHVDSKPLITHTSLRPI